MARYFLIIGCLTAFLAVQGISVAEEAGAERKLAEHVVATIATRPDWERIKVLDADATGYGLELFYRETPNGFAQVEADTKSVVRAVLSELMKAGHSPTHEGIVICVWGQRLVKGETGTSRVLVYGNATYDYNSDSIEFERGK